MINMNNEENVFYAKINLDLIKEYIFNLMLINEEVCLNINNNGFYIMSIDSSNVSMIKSYLSKNEFINYILKDSSNIKIGLDLLKIYDILNNYNQNCNIDLYINTIRQKLEIHIENMIYKTSLLDVSVIKNETKDLSIQFNNEIYINGSELKKALKIADKINDYIIFELNKNKLYIKTKNEDENFSLCLNSNVIKNKNEDSLVSSIYSIEYLLNISKGIAKLDNIILSIGQDYPLQMKYNLKNKDCHFIYILAPRIEQE